MSTSLLALLLLTLSTQEPSVETLYETAELARKENRADEALAGFRAALAKQPDHVPSHLGYQKLLQHQKKEPELVAEYEALHKKHAAPWTFFLYGRLLHDAAKEEELYRQGLELQKNNRWLREELVKVLRRQRRFDEAIRAQRGILKDDKDSLEAHQTFIGMMNDARRYEELLATYPASLDPAQDTAHSLAIRGAALVFCGQGAEGMPILEKAAKLAPRNMRVLECLAIGLAKTKQFDRGIEVFTEVLRLDPFDPRSLRTYGLLLSIIKRDQAGFEHLRKSVRLEPGDSEGLSELGQAHLVYEEYESAEKCLREALRLNGLNDLAMYRMGILQFNRKDNTACIEWTQKAIAINDQEASYHHLLGTAYTRLGKTDPARESLEKASRLKSQFDVTVKRKVSDDDILLIDPKEAECSRLISLASILLQEGKTAEARAKFDEALKTDPTNSTPQYALALIHLRLEEWAPALTRFEQLKGGKKNPSMAARSSLRAADCLYELGRSKEAADAYRATLEAFGDSLSSFERPGEILEALKAATPASEKHRIPGVRIGACAKTNYCVPESLDCVLRYWKRPSDVEDIGKEMIADRGARLPAILSYLKKRSDITFSLFVGETEVLKGLLKQGFPVLLFRRMPLRKSTDGHVCVVAGYDDKRQLFILEDSLWYAGAQYAPYEAIRGQLMMLVAPPEETRKVTAALSGGDYCDQVVEWERCLARDDLPGWERAIRKALELRPDSVEAHLQMGILLLTRKESREALDWLRKAIILPGADALAHVLLADALIRSKEPEEAAKSLATALRLEPDYADALHFLGSLRLNRGDPAGAEAPLRKLVSLDEERDKGRLLLGEVLVRLGKPDEAIRHLSCAARNPELSIAYKWLSLAWAKSGNRTRAISALDKYMEALKDPEERAKMEEFLKELKAGPAKK